MKEQEAKKQEKKSRHIADFKEHYVSAGSLEQFDPTKISYAEWRAREAPESGGIFSHTRIDRMDTAGQYRFFFVDMKAEEDREGVTFFVRPNTTDEPAAPLFECFEPDEKEVAEAIHQAVCVEKDDLSECSRFMKLIEKVRDSYVRHLFYHERMIVDNCRFFGLGKVCSKDEDNTLLVFDNILFTAGAGYAQNVVGTGVALCNIDDPVIIFTDCDGRRFSIHGPVEAERNEDHFMEGIDGVNWISFCLPNLVQIDRAEPDEEAAKSVPPTLASLDGDWEEYAGLHEPCITTRKKAPGRKSRLRGLAGSL